MLSSFFILRKEAAMRGPVPQVSIERLTYYLRELERLKSSGRRIVSSSELGELMNVNPAQIRKDLSRFGEFGKRGVGYRVNALCESIRRILGLDTPRKVAIVGAGNLGTALARYRGFAKYNIRISALFDIDDRKTGRRIGGLVVRHVHTLPEVLSAEGIDLLIAAVPAENVQQVCDMAVEAGVKGIVNFAPLEPKVPPTVRVRNVDLSVQVQILSFYVHGKGADVRSAGETKEETGDH